MLDFDRRLSVSLLALRLGVFVVMIAWTLDKFVNPDHAGGVFAAFYGLPGLDATVFYVIGGVQLVVVVAFVIGLLKRWSYGLVLLMHAISTLSSWPKYLDPWNSLLFFAAWPMLAACLALYLLRDHDRLLSVDTHRNAAAHPEARRRR